MNVSRRDFMKIGGLSVAATGFTAKALASAQNQTLDQVRQMVENVKPLEQLDYDRRMEKAVKPGGQKSPNCV